MKNKNKFSILIGIVALLPLFVLAQAPTTSTPNQASNLSVISIDTAGTLYGIQKGDKYIQLLAGDVQMSHQGSQMYCDSAVLDEADKSFEAFGNVYILQADGTTLLADYIHYNGKNSQCIAKGSVELNENENTLWTEMLNYNLNTKIGTYTKNGTLKTGETLLWSQWGQYNGETHWSHFRGHVIIEDPEYYVTSDELEYNTETRVVKFLKHSEILKDETLMITEGGTYNSLTRYADFTHNTTIYNDKQAIKAEKLRYDKEAGIAWAVGKVKVSDTSEHAILYSDEAFYFDRTKQSIAYGNPVLVRYSTEDADTTFLLCDTLQSFSIVSSVVNYMEKDSLGENHTVSDTTYKRNYLAWYHVKILSDSMQAIGDSIYYNEMDSVIRFYKNPILWSAARQLKGDTIFVYLQNNNKLDSVFLMQKSSILERLSDVPQGMNQILGQWIYAYFAKGDLHEVYVNKNTQVIYYPQNEKDQYIGINKTESQSMNIFFDNGKIDQIKIYKDISGTTYPMTGTDYASMKFDNSIWYDALRPESKQDFYDRMAYIHKAPPVVTPSTTEPSPGSNKNTKKRKKKRKKG